MYEYYFTEEEMDGKAIAIGLSTTPGPDWLKDIIKKVGQRLKLHRDLRGLLMKTQPTLTSPQSQAGNVSGSPSLFSPPISPPTPTQRTRTCSSSPTLSVVCDTFPYRSV